MSLVAGVKMGVENPEGKGTVRARWNTLDSARSQILNRGRQCAELTIPALLPPAGFTENQELVTPYQGLGARAINNLSSKLLLAMLAPNTPFFKLDLDNQALLQLKDDPDTVSLVASAFAEMERATLKEIEDQGMRVPFALALKYLVVVGYTLMYLPDDGGAITYRPDQFVVVRDPMGNLLEVVIQERIHISLLPPEVQSIAAKSKACDDTVELYTQVKRRKNLMYVVQEACGQTIESSRGTYPVDECPWIAPRWSALAGENYGRGHVEEYIGDIRSSESLTQSIVEGSAAAAKVVFLNNPNGTTNAKKVASAKSGDIVTGNKADIAAMQLDKFNDFKVALEALTRIETAISQAFLLMSSIQRNAERVTAEEIRAMATELENTLGGVYSLLSLELQLPFLKRHMARMRRQSKLPPLPKKLVKPVITTGVDALSRSYELTKIEQFLAGLPPDALARIKWEKYLLRRATALNVDVKDMIKSDEEVAQETQQTMLANMAAQAGPKVAQEITKGAVQNAPQETDPGTHA
ncbi:portal protein [Geobacter sp. SVR]|uniref:portal protein n=1 Tax=Geobacter sp. SVR TaxID=2495594 RepID=UPI00143EF4DA|nr:portal protein [Geobacter sp. SVR]BCS53312.1 hypothetical protein GSVR_16200 [Geobacter sp. SVR]GCF85562.1 hypothetical protein GSbR_21620 [Geobacter sp. SVR]